ncbi:response regulator transcription factor [Steroidobacter flavus]|uniref:Response regulator transcription factor n=1 Tax=Steroidobacter flavus TaxID=1842136 RepID=A0ABV8T2J1_9GAMM
MRILVADDDTELLGLLQFSLSQAGYEVLTAVDGSGALATFQRELPDFALLDFTMPQLDGLAVCREIRQRSTIPIMMLTARNREDDLVAALDSGADDFVTKPFSPRILLARIRSLVRRTESPPAAFVETGVARFDPTQRTLQLGGDAPFRLTSLETKMVGLFLNSPGRTILTEQIARHLWGRASAHERHTLKQLIYRLRQKMEQDPSNPRVLQTTAGAGYRFVVE